MATKTIGIILHGATGRICSTQHLKNALVADPRRRRARRSATTDVVPRLMLVGRDAERVAAVARAHGVDDWTTDLDAALADQDFSVFFDAAATHQRAAVLAKAIAAGKHIYAEKPVATSVAQGEELLRAIEARGLSHGAVEDKLYLPGLQKLAHVVKSGALGTIVGFRLEFGWWVFDGVEVACQRPSWNYRRAGGGGLIFDMYPHWRYVIEGLLGSIRRVVTTTATATPERIDENGTRYTVDVEDTATTLVELASGACGTLLNSWATRVRRDDLLTLPDRRQQGVGYRRPASLLDAEQCAGAAHRTFQCRSRSRHRLSRRLAGGRSPRTVPQSLSHRLGELPAPPCERHADVIRPRGRYPRRGVCRGVPAQQQGGNVGELPGARVIALYAAAADFPIAALTRGITSSAISCIERFEMAGSTQSIPA